MLPKESTFAIFQSLYKVTLETYEDGVQRQRCNVKNENLDATSTVVGKLGRSDSLKVYCKALQS